MKTMNDRHTQLRRARTLDALTEIVVSVAVVTSMWVSFVPHQLLAGI